ncbi:MAG: RuBisCO large subunit C-terminal-like domain-containing protein [Bacillota bacterium]
MLPNPTLHLSGERFAVLYRMTASSEAEVREKAFGVAVEQTIEFPYEIAPAVIQETIVGRIESIEPGAEKERLSAGPGAWLVRISYAVESSGFELTQLLNVIFGNSSIKPGIRVERLELPDAILGHFKGPRFGRQGLRERLGVTGRPLLCTALKPMGLSASDLAQLAYQFALGGIDIIKDDHGLADQPFSPFVDRVARCAEAVERANRETGRKSIYMPNVTAPADRLQRYARKARELGAGGLLVAPGLAGFDAMRALADDDEISLPIMSHPAFLGSFVTSPENGISHYALFGQICRLAGADATVYPNWGGRFSFSKEECASIAEGSAASMGHLKPIFPAPGGGMSLERVPEMHEVYGHEVIFLIGGGLFKSGPDLVQNCRNFLQMIS